MATRASKQRVLAARICEIADLAEAVADAHCPTGSVDPVAIARKNRITSSFGHYGKAFDGMLEHKAGRFHIFCNLDQVRQPDSPRARFTFAHELGHFYLDEHRNALAAGRAPAHRSQCEYESPNLVEQEADHFASNLLMPPSRFTARAERASVGFEGVLALANHFKTSVTSTAIRYAAADVAPCAVVKWTRKGYSWKWLSSATFRARFRKTIEAPEDVPDDSPTGKALAGQDPPEAGYFQAGTTASAWFPRVGRGWLRDVIFIEQAMPLGRYGVLTFLYPEAGAYEFVNHQ